MAEILYQNLKNGIAADSPLKADSIHFLQVPTHDPELLDERVEEMVRYMQEAIELGRTARDRRNCPLRMPVKNVRIIHRE